MRRVRSALRAARRDTLALLLAPRDPRVPWYAKTLAAVVVAYALSPIDLIPDFIPVLGYADDILLIPLGVIVVSGLIPGTLMEELRERVAGIGVSRRLRWAGAAAVLAAWLLVAALVLLAVWG